MKNTEHIILFDGICNFCNSSINFIIKYDKKKIFKFAPLQSKYGQHLLTQNNLNTTTFNSLIYSKRNDLYVKSTGVIHILYQLGGFWSIFIIFLLIPPFLRNFIYDLIAKNRYRLFGKKDICMIPSEDVKSRFLE